MHEKSGVILWNSGQKNNELYTVAQDCFCDRLGATFSKIEEL